MQTRRLWVTGLALAGLAVGSTASVAFAQKKAPVRKPASGAPAKSARTAKPAADTAPQDLAEPVYRQGMATHNQE